MPFYFPPVVPPPSIPSEVLGNVNALVTTPVDTAGNTTISTGDSSSPFQQSGDVFVTSGAQSGGPNSGGVNFATGTATNGGASGLLGFTTGPADNNSSGQMAFETGPTNVSGNSGNLTSATGTAADSSGTFTVRTGDAANGDSGGVAFFSGNSNAANSGDVFFATGNAPIRGGSLRFTILSPGPDANFVFTGMPTSDPAISGALWVDTVTNLIHMSP